MAVITLYLRSLLVLLIGLSSLVQGRSLLLPRDPRPVTEPNQAPGLINPNGPMLKSVLSYYSNIKARLLSRFPGQDHLVKPPLKFSGRGHLRVSDTPLRFHTSAITIGVRSVGWLNSHGQLTTQKSQRAVFTAQGSKEPGFPTLSSSQGYCYIRTKDSQLDCTAKTVDDTLWGWSIQVDGNNVVEAFRTQQKSDKGIPRNLTALEGNKSAGYKVFIDWVPK